MAKKSNSYYFFSSLIFF